MIHRAVVTLPLSLAFVSLLAGTAGAQTFTDLGPGRATAVSADGKTVVGGGSGGQATGAWIWTAAGGKVAIGAQNAYGASSDGSIVLGQDINLSNKNDAALWTSPTGWQQLGGITGSNGCGSDLTNPYALSDAGDVATGLGWVGCFASAFRWSAQLGMIGLPKVSNNARGNAVSGDGSTIGGWDSAPNGSRIAAIWSSNNTESLVLVDPILSPDGDGETWGFSTNGTWAIGQGGTAALGAFRWSQATGVQYLGPLAGFGFPATGRAVRDDGNLIVGHAGSVFTGIHAFAWTPQGGMQTLESYLTSKGVVLPPGTNLGGVSDMTADGRTIVGWMGPNAFFESGFVVTLPPDCGSIKYGVGASAVNTIDLDGAGNSAVGGNFSAVSSNLGSIPLVVVAVSTGQSHAPLFGGLVLVNLAGIFMTHNVVPAAGVATWSTGIPPDPNLAGLSFYLQSAGPDAGQPQGIALSNGLKLTICP